MKKTFGILAHVDAGKTTFAEGILFHGNAINKIGRVDHKNSFLDNHTIEKERGITVFAEQAAFYYGNCEYYLIDTLGHVDFTAEMERAIEVMDYAIVVISGVDGVQGHTKTVWKLLRQYHVPTFLFINKTDREGTDVSKVIAELKKKLSPNIVDMTGLYDNGNLSEELIEWVAEKDDDLLEYYLEHGYEAEQWKKSIKEMIESENIFPCMSGSALLDKGIADFLEVFHELTGKMETETNTGEFAARVYKIRHDEQGNRLTFIKILSGQLRVKGEIAYGGGEYREKVNQFRFYNGNKYEAKEYAYAGDIAALTGLTHAKAGDGLGAKKEPVLFKTVPTLCASVIFPKEKPFIIEYFKLFEAEGMISACNLEENLGELQIHIMGSIQLEVLKELIKERFSYEVDFEEPKVLYKETITKPVNGYVHFEPLRHYAEVALELAPAERNSGIHFKSICHIDKLSILCFSD